LCWTPISSCEPSSGNGSDRFWKRTEDQASFYTPDVCFEDARKYIPDISSRRRLDVDLALSVLDQISRMVEPVDRSLYEDYQEIARGRVLPRDPDDWPVAVVALLLGLPIWTEDQDFFGSGIPTWTTGLSYFCESSKHQQKPTGIQGRTLIHPAQSLSRVSLCLTLQLQITSSTRKNNEGRLGLKNAHERFGKLVYRRRTEKTATNLRVFLDAFVGEDGGKAHLVSVVGGDVEIGALAAAFANGDSFSVTQPSGTESLVSLGENQTSVNGCIACRRRPLP